MTVWPLQNVVLYSAPYERVYIAPRASAGYCVWLIYIAALLLFPAFLAYASGNLWIKEAFYREQPLVRFQHSMVFAVQGETQSFFWSTDPKLNDLNSGDLAVPDVRYQELDKDVDGLPDELVIKAAFPAAGGARRVSFLGTFSYQLQQTVRLSMKGLVAVEESAGVPANGLTLRGTLEMRQKKPLRSLPEPRTVYDVDPLAFEVNSHEFYQKFGAPFNYGELLSDYANRNETLLLSHDIPPLWNYHGSKDAFQLEVRLQIPKQVVYYVPSALTELKNGWIHMASFLFPVYIILSGFLRSIYTNQIVQTYCCSQLPYMNKTD